MLTKDKEFYKMITSIALPIALQNLITFAVGMLDSIMIGRLGQTPLAGVTLANQFFYIFMILIFGIGSGSNILIAQYWGKGDTHAIHKIMGIMYRLGVSVALLFMLGAAFFPTTVMSIFTNEKAVIIEGTKYLQIIFISYIFCCITNVTISSLRAVQTVTISLLVYSCSLLVNGFLNWVLIFGNLGAPALGVRGAAIATVFARFTEFCIISIFMIKKEKKILFKVKSIWEKDKQMLSDFIKVGAPVVVNELLWGLGASTLIVIVGRMGEAVVAANSINSIMYQFVSIFTMGVGNAGAVIVGNTVGSGRYEKTKEYAETLVVVGIGLGIMAGCVLFFIRPYVLMLYNIPDATKQIAMQIMQVFSFVVFFQANAFVLMIGILRGGGDTKFVLVCDIIFLWMVAIPFGFVAAIVWKLPIPIVFMILKCDEALKVMIAFIRFKSGKWIKNVTR